MPKHPDIPADGFLVEPWPALKRKIREGERGRMFDFSEEMNRYAMTVACDLRARRSVPSEAHGLLFYLKALYCFQGAGERQGGSASQSLKRPGRPVSGYLKFRQRVHQLHTLGK